MTALPATVQVGPFTYTVTDDALEHAQAQAEEKRLLNGHCDTGALKITIDPDLAADVARATVLHEVLHAAYDLAALEEMQLNRLDDAETFEEAIVRGFEAPLLMIIRDNPELLRYLAT